MNSLEVREFYRAIANFTTQSTLPIEVKRLCIKDILLQLEESANAEIKEQFEARKEQESEG